MDEITISMVAPAFPYFPVWIAQLGGFFSERDITCATEVTGTTDKVTSSIKDMQSEIGMVTPEGVIVDATRGGSLRLVAGNTNRPPLTLIGGKDIRRIEDLKGRTVGTSSLSEGTAIMVQKMLAAHDLRYPGDYEFALVGAHPQRWDALQAGTIDAGLQLVPYDYIAEDAGYPSLGAALQYIPQYAFTAIAVNLDWADPHRDVVVRALSAMREATRWARRNISQAAEMLQEPTRTDLGYARRALAAMFEDEISPEDLRIRREALDVVFEAVREVGLVEPELELAYERCVDDSFLDAATR